MARRWVEFHRDHIAPAYPDFGEWFRVTGTTKSGIAHAHVVWFGAYLPKWWLIEKWGRFSGGDDAVWVEAVKGATGGGVARYLSLQFVEYLAGQEVRARWSSSAGWRERRGGEMGLGPRTPAPLTLNASALAFVEGDWYQGRKSRLPDVYRDAHGALRSRLRVADLVRHVSTAGPAARPSPPRQRPDSRS
jgi:hypothetical protein